MSVGLFHVHSSTKRCVLELLHRVRKKNCATLFFALTLPDAGRFQNSFTVRLGIGKQMMHGMVSVSCFGEKNCHHNLAVAI